MIVVNKDLLAAFSHAGNCEWCKVRAKVDVHHIWPRGLGGGSRLDIRINLIALCRQCHDDVHAGHILRIDLLAIVAGREDVMQHHIERIVWWLLRLPKNPSEERVAKSFKLLQPQVAILARLTWIEVQKCLEIHQASPKSKPSKGSKSSRSKSDGDARTTTF